MNRLYLSVLVVVSLTLVSCEDYLSKLPSKGVNQPITEIEQIEALLDNFGIFSIEGGNDIAAYITDDYEISMDLYSSNPSKFPQSLLHYFIYDEQMIPKESSDPHWEGEYTKISNANIIINNIKKVTGDDSVKEQLLAEAYFIRAYSYWTLVSTYCLPYSPKNFHEQGLPKKESINYDDDLTRVSLEEIYQFIEQDLTKAAHINNRNIEKRWRLNKNAYHAFMSRFRLFKGEYKEAAKEATLALEGKDVSLLNYATLKRGKPRIYSAPADTIPYCETNDYPDYRYLKWNEFYYTRFIRSFPNQWNIPGKSLLDLYDKENDYRFINFFMPNSNRRFAIKNIKTYGYTVFEEGAYLLSGPTIGEVLLNKAEALCRMRIELDEAKGALFTLQSNRIKNVGYSKADTPEKLLQEILRERRRELPFSMRFYDIKRFSVNETAADDVEVSKQFYEVLSSSVNQKKIKTYTLPVGSRRYAFPINEIEIVNSNNQIKQNIY